MLEIITTKDGKKVIYEDGSVRLVDAKELELEKADIEKRIEVMPDDKQLLEWARANYLMVDHTRELERLSEINLLLEEIK